MRTLQCLSEMLSHYLMEIQTTLHHSLIDITISNMATSSHPSNSSLSKGLKRATNQWKSNSPDSDTSNPSSSDPLEVLTALPAWQSIQQSMRSLPNSRIILSHHIKNAYNLLTEVGPGYRRHPPNSTTSQSPPSDSNSSSSHVDRDSSDDYHPSRENCPLEPQDFFEQNESSGNNSEKEIDRDEQNDIGI